MEVNITVSSFTGIICNLDASLGWTIGQVRDEIEKSSGIAKADQRLFLNNQLVTEDFQCLRELLPAQKFFGAGADFAFKCGPRGGLMTSLDVILLQREPEASSILKLLRGGSKDTLKQLLHDGKSEIIKRDQELFELAYGLSEDALQFASRDFALTEVRKNPIKLKYVSDNLKSDKELILAAVREMPSSLKEAGQDMQNDKEVVLAALESGSQASQAWMYVASELKNDRDVILKLVSRDGWQLKSLPNNWTADRDVVLAAVQNTGSALQFAAEHLQNDRSVALLGVCKTASAIQHISKDLLADRTFWMAALEQNGEALKYGSDEVKSDKELVSVAVQQNGCALRHAADSLRENVDVVRKAVEQHPYAINYAAEILRANSSIPRNQKRQRIADSA